MLPVRRWNLLGQDRPRLSKDSLDDRPVYNSRLGVFRHRTKMVQKAMVNTSMGLPPMGCPHMGFPPMSCPHIGFHPMGCSPMCYHPMGYPPMGYPPMSCPHMSCQMGCPMCPMMSELSPFESSYMAPKFPEKKPSSEKIEESDAKLDEWLKERAKTGNATPVSTTQSNASYSSNDDPQDATAYAAAYPTTRTWLEPKSRLATWELENSDERDTTSTPSSWLDSDSSPSPNTWMLEDSSYISGKDSGISHSWLEPESKLITWEQKYSGETADCSVSETIRDSDRFTLCYPIISL